MTLILKVIYFSWYKRKLWKAVLEKKKKKTAHFSFFCSCFGEFIISSYIQAQEKLSCWSCKPVLVWTKNGTVEVRVKLEHESLIDM